MKKLTIFLISSLPLISYGADDPRVFSNIVNIFFDLISAAIPVLAGAAMLVFFWGLVKFIANAADTKNHKEGLDLMKWGVVALFVMVSYMSILRFLSTGFGIESFGFPFLPTS